MSELVLLRESVWSTILSRLKESNVQLSMYHISDYDFVLPSCTTYKSTWEQLCSGAAMLIPDEQLCPMLGLKRITADSPDEPGIMKFYMRCWQLKAEQLSKVITKWESEGVWHEEAESWSAIIAALRPESPVFVRYIGQTHSTNGWQRLQKDLKQRSFGVFHHFTSAVEHLFPAVFNTVRVSEFMPARTKYGKSQVEQHRADDVERLYIHLFHMPTLLNRQSGGHHVGYQAPDSDYALFKTLRTDVCARLQTPEPHNSTASTTADTLTPRIKGLIWECASFANNHPSECATDRQIVTDKAKRAWLREALPNADHRRGQVVFLGSWVTWDDWLIGYWKGASRSARLQKDFWSRIAEWDASTSTSEAPTRWPLKEQIYSGDCESLFPFWDLWRWPTRCKTAEGLEFMRRYLDIVRPTLTVTQSHVVSTNVAGSFLYEVIRSGEYIFEVGVIRIAYYAPSIWYRSNAEMPEDQCTLHIPQLDPGHIRYHDAEGGSLACRVQNLAYFVIWTAMDELLRNAINEGETRILYCLRLKSAIDKRLDDADGFHAAFEEAKRALYDYGWSECEKNLNKAEPSYTEVERHGVLQLVATGEPYSKHRLDEVEGIWEKNMPELHVTYSRKRREEWTRWALGIKIGSVYALAAYQEALLIGERMAAHPGARNDIRRKAIVEPLQNERFLKALDHHSAEPSDTATQLSHVDRKQLHRVQKAAYDRMHEGVKHYFPNGRFIVGNTSDLRLENGQDLHKPRQDLQHARVIANCEGDVIFSWRSPSGEVQKFTVWVLAKNEAKLKHDDDFRTIHFLPDGIDVRDCNGTPVRASIGSQPAKEDPCRLVVTIPFRELFTRDKCVQLVRLWEWHTKIDAIQKLVAIHDIPANVEQWPSAAYGQSGRPFGKTAPGEVKTTPEISDAAWLLQLFMDEHFADGGVIRICNPNFGVEPGSFLPALTTWLFQGPYHNHPYFGGVVELATRWYPTKTTRYLVNLITSFRQCSFAGRAGELDVRGRGNIYTYNVGPARPDAEAISFPHVRNAYTYDVKRPGEWIDSGVASKRLKFRQGLLSEQAVVLAEPVDPFFKPGCSAGRPLFHLREDPQYKAGIRAMRREDAIWLLHEFLAHLPHQVMRGKVCWHLWIGPDAYPVGIDPSICFWEAFELFLMKDDFCDHPMMSNVREFIDERDIHHLRVLVEFCRWDMIRDEYVGIHCNQAYAMSVLMFGYSKLDTDALL